MPTINLNHCHGKFIWTNESICLYRETLENKVVRVKIKTFNDANFMDCDSITESFSSILVDAAKQSVKFVKKMPGKRKRKLIKKPWSSNSCHDLHNTVKNYETLVNKSPYNGLYRKLFLYFQI